MENKTTKTKTKINVNAEIDNLHQFVGILANEIAARIVCDDDFVEDLGREIADNLFLKYQKAAEDRCPQNRFWQWIKSF